MLVLNSLSILMLIQPHVCFTCPPAFMDLGEGLCVVSLNRTSRLCGAMDICARFGERDKQMVYLIGRNIPRIPPSLVDNRVMHAGINFLLEPPTSGTVVWRDLDPNTPEYTATEKEFGYDIRPGWHSSRYVPRWVPGERLVRDISGWSSHSSRTVYEYGGVLPDVDRKVRFRSDIPKSLLVLVHSDARFVGCERKMSVRTQLECARRCALYSVCRSFKSGTNNCIHMMHTDSLLSLISGGGGSGWVRFAKTSLALKLSDGKYQVNWQASDGSAQLHSCINFHPLSSVFSSECLLPRSSINYKTDLLSHFTRVRPINPE